jgi:hypothetical protein
VKPEEKRHRQMGERLSAEFGVPVEMFVRNCWPNQRMAEFVARALDEVQPDLVYLNITTFPFSYESTPLRVKRILGKVGEPVGDAGFRLAESKRWSHNAVFRTLRSWAQATIGGDTHFTTSEVTERYSELIRLLLRREGTVIAVKGPLARSKKGITKRERLRHERRRQEVHGAIKHLCEQLHVPYYGSDEPYWVVKPQPKGTKAGDGTHANAAGHQVLADDHYEKLRDAWARHLEEAADATPPRKQPAVTS